MPNCDPRYRFFYPSLTLMMDSYNIIGKKVLCVCRETDGNQNIPREIMPPHFSHVDIEVH